MTDSLGSSLLFVTLVNRSHLAFADSLFASVLRRYPEAATFAYLVDEWPEGASPPERFSVELLEPEGRPHHRSRLFSHNRFQRVVTWKSLAISRAIDRFPGRQRVVYLDADTWVIGSLEPLLRTLDSASVVLTPHLVSSSGEAGMEQQLLRVGIYNGGVLAFQAEKAGPFLRWWESRIEVDCVHSPQRGLFLEQKWLDHAPALFDDVAICRHPGVNTAYWRLRSLAKDRATEGVPIPDLDLELVRLFHFSGWSPHRPEFLSRHRGGDFTPAPRSNLGRLLTSYDAEVRNSAYLQFYGQSGAFDSYYDGEEISDWDSFLYRTYWSRVMPEDWDPYCGLPSSPFLSALRRAVALLMKRFPGLESLDAVPGLRGFLERLARAHSGSSARK